MFSLLPKRNKLPVQMWGWVRLVVRRLQDLRGLWWVWRGRLHLHPWYSNWRAILPTPNRWLSALHGMLAHFISSFSYKKKNKKQKHDAATSPTFWTVPTRVYEYEVMIEVNTTDVDRLRDTLKSVAFPAWVGARTNVSHAAITTGKKTLFAVSVHSTASVSLGKISFFFFFFKVCRSDGGTVQCRCEDGHSWPCDKCLTYGRCDNDTNTCGCIRGFPTDGQLCQSTNPQSEFHSIFWCLTSYLIAMISCITNKSLFCFVCFFSPKIFPHVRRQQVKHARPWSMLYLPLSRAVFSGCVCCSTFPSLQLLQFSVNTWFRLSWTSRTLLPWISWRPSWTELLPPSGWTAPSMCLASTSLRVRGRTHGTTHRKRSFLIKIKDEVTSADKTAHIVLFLFLFFILLVSSLLCEQG